MRGSTKRRIRNNVLIEETGRLTFEVRSSQKDSRYTVDMSENSGCGKCDCWHWKKQIGPSMAAHTTPATLTAESKWDCPHIAAVRFYISDKLIQVIRQKYPDFTSSATI